MNKKIFAPVVIFAYNRPKELQNLLSSLELNSELKMSKIIFFIDRNKSSIERLRKTSSKNRYDNSTQTFYNKAQISFIKLSRSSTNYFILASSSNNSFLEHKIYKICKKYLSNT